MSDNRRRYETIRDEMLNLYPGEPKGRLKQSLQVLAMFINGIVGSQSTHNRNVAKKTPTGAKASSREQQLRRWYENKGTTYEMHMLPFVQDLLLNLTDYKLVFAIDGSGVGRGCVTLMVSLIYKKRAIPIIWVVREGKKGHFPADMHVELLQNLQDILPEEASVIILGDGEFDSVELQRFVNDAGWSYVVRTAKNTQICIDGEWLPLDDTNNGRGSCIPVYDVMFTKEEYGPVLAIAWWRKEYAEPIYLVTNLELMEEACQWYRKRMTIETFFSDQKSRGFRLDKSRISNPKRLFRVMIAACLAYIWVIYLGVIGSQEPWRNQIHRPDRCDLSLFQLGLDLLEHFLNEDLPILFGFRLPSCPPF